MVRGQRRLYGVAERAPHRLERTAAVLTAMRVSPATPPLYLGADERWPQTRVAAVLGATHPVLVVDLNANPDANDVAALCGCVAGGGAILFSFAGEPGELTPFWRRFRAMLEAAPAARVIDADSDFADLPPIAAATAATGHPTADQQTAIDAILRCARGRARRPLVLRSDRGRGKSAAMGMAVAALDPGDDTTVIVTAHSRQAVATVFDFAGRGDDAACPRLQFAPPDELLRSPRSPRLLLIDEAATLPATMLEQLLRRYPRVVLATTVDGYEGSGRGFDLRFAPQLQTLFPQTRTVYLAQPVRWDAGDAAEALTNRAFGLAAGSAAAVRATPAALEAVSFRHYTNAQLVAENRLLEAAWRLLVDAHHQTSPADLQLLLDDPAMSLVCGFAGDALVAVALLRREGGIDRDLAMAIAAGDRRLRGERLPQTLAWYCQQPGLAQRYAWRVVRIAVRDDCRRCGVGSRLLHAVEGLAQRAGGIGYLGASFAADAATTAFWLASGYRPLRLGVQRDTGSGLQSLLVVRALESDIDEAFTGLAAQFQSDLQLELAGVYRDLAPALVLTLLAPGQVAAAHSSVHAARRFAAGVGSCELLAADLWRWCAAVLPALPSDNPAALLLCEKILLRRDWPAFCEAYAFDGRKAAEAALRAAVGEVLVVAPTVL